MANAECGMWTLLFVGGEARGIWCDPSNRRKATVDEGGGRKIALLSRLHLQDMLKRIFAWERQLFLPEEDM
jgi:hypothetical protein